MQVSVVGTGYVGLVTGVCFSEFGDNVTCIDKDADKIAKLKKAIPPIYEPGLEELIRRNAKEKRLHFTTSLEEGVKHADIIFVAVGTPTGENDLPNMHALNSVIEALAQLVEDNAVIVIKSTVPVGTTRRMRERIKELNPSLHFTMASNPEFLREGSAIDDFMKPDRVVIGVDSPIAKDVLSRLYAPINLGGYPLFTTNFESAELVKYASNSLLATKVAFINEMADICEKSGANIRDVSKGIGLDKRIGPKFLQPGPGYGGSCFPKDTLALAAIAKQLDAPTRIVESVIQSNHTRKQQMVGKILSAIGESAANKTIAILGLTFKPGTDDMRDSPALEIIPGLQEAGAKLRIFDPQGMENAKTMLSGTHITWCKNAYDALLDTDAAVILTEWNEFRSLDLSKIKLTMHTPLIIDLRNIYKRHDVMVAGFTYHSIGRASVTPETENITDASPVDEVA